jgi:hypothetical protein
MEIQVFGKQNCGKCDSTKHKVAHLLGKHGLQERIPFKFFDLDTVDGLAEGAYRDVHAVPTTIIEDDGRDLVRWEGVIPDSVDIKQYLGTA